MATLALGVVGAGIGSVTGVGAGAGWALGTTLGRVLFPETGGSAASGLSDLKITGASYGAMIPKIYGSMRLAGNVIWTGPLTSETVSSGGGGKGGGSSSSTQSRVYSVSFAVAIAEGELGSLLKIWADGTVIYDRSSSGEALASDVRARFYSGSVEQLPDSVMEAVEGAGRVPAYRGLCYVVFDELPLQAYGNRLPNIEVLVSTAGLNTYPETSGTVTTGSPGSIAYDPVRGQVFTYEVAGSPDRVRKFNALTLDEVGAVEIDTVFPRLPSASVGFSRDRAGRFWIGSGNGLLPGRKIHLVDGDSLAPIRSTDLPTGIGAVTASSDIVSTLTGERFQAAGSQQSSQAVVFDSDLEVIGLMSTTAPVCTGALTDEDEMAWLAFSGQASGPAVSDLDIVAVSISASQGVGGITHQAQFEITTLPSSSLTPLGGAGNETNTITDLVAYLPQSRELVFQNDYRLFKWSMESKTITVTRDGTGFGGALSLLNTHNDSELVYLKNGRYVTYLSAETLLETEQVDLQPFAGITTTVQGCYDADSDSFLALQNGQVPRRLYLRRQAGQDAAVADIVFDLSTAAGLMPSQIDVSGLSGSVPGFIVSRPMSVSDALQPLMHVGFFDAVECSGKIIYIPRNNNPEISISDQDLLAPPQVRRQQEGELPASISLNYLASENGFQVGSQSERRMADPVATMFGTSQITRDLPMALTADQARQTCQKTLSAAWTERQSMEMALPIRYLALDPADVVTVDLAGAVRPVRLTGSTFGADMRLQANGALIATDGYKASVTGEAGSGYSQVLIQRGTEAELFLLNLPLLQDQDATAGVASRFYFALDGYQGSAAGSVLYGAAEDGPFEVEGEISSDVTWGVTLDALPDVDKPWQTDRTSSVDIRFVNGGEQLESIPEAALLMGGNALLIGSEIIQFANVSLNVDGSYRLSTLLRGRRGTETSTGSHSLGEKAVLLEANNLGSGIASLADLNIPRSWKAVSPGRNLEGVAKQIVPLTGRDLMPYAPVHLNALRSPGLVSLSWVRRSRLGSSGLASILPIAEASETYELVFTFNGASVSKYVREATAFEYDLATFNSDFAVSESEIPILTLTLYQISEAIGRGSPATEIL